MPTGPLWNNDLSDDQVALLPANTLKEKDPRRYEAIVSLLKSGCAIKTITQATGAHHSTVQRIMVENEDASLTVPALAAKMGRLAHNAADRIQEILEDPERREEVAFKDVAVAMGIAADKLDRLASSGAPITQNNVQININEASDLQSMLDSLPQPKPAKKAPVIDVTDSAPED